MPSHTGRGAGWHQRGGLVSAAGTDPPRCSEVSGIEDVSGLSGTEAHWLGSPRRRSGAAVSDNAASEWVPTGSVTVQVPGKVNLYLEVGDLRADGYHELTTVFHAVSLFDEVTVRNADVLSVEIIGDGVDGLRTDERN